MAKTIISLTGKTRYEVADVIAAWRDDEESDEPIGDAFDLLTGIEIYLRAAPPKVAAVEIHRDAAKELAVEDADFSNVFQAKTAWAMGFDAGFAAALRKHVYWAPGEPDCPREIKAPNGELHTLRCKVCGLNSPKDSCIGGKDA